jgi:hypothetical protein
VRWILLVIFCVLLPGCASGRPYLAGPWDAPHLSVTADDVDAETCQVHELPLQDGDAQILYGLIVPTKEYQRASMEWFPHAGAWVWGGCVWSPDVAEEAVVKYCSACREAYSQWSANRDEQFE